MELFGTEPVINGKIFWSLALLQQAVFVVLTNGRSNMRSYALSEIG
jgi:hypothetical protein